MSYEMNFEMYVEAKEQRKEVLAVIKKALLENGYEKYADNFVANKKNPCLIEETTCCSFNPITFNDAIKTIYSEVVKELPEVMFKGRSGCVDGSADVAHTFERKDNTLEVCIHSYEGCGCCPECDEEVVARCAA